MSHVSTGDEANASMSPRLARGVFVAGVILVVVSVAGYAGVLALVARERVPNVTSLALLPSLGLPIGATLLGMADVRRRRAGPAVYATHIPGLVGRAARYRVRRISAWWQLLWLVLLGVPSIALFVLPEVIKNSSTVGDPVAFTAFAWLGGITVSFVTGMVFVSLFKKLVTPPLQRANPGVVPRDGFIRTVLYFWRSDLYFGAAGFVLGAVAWQPAITGYLLAAIFLWFVASILVIIGLVLALNFWRTGESLDDAVLSTIRRHRNF